MRHKSNALEFEEHAEVAVAVDQGKLVHTLLLGQRAHEHAM